MGSVRVVHLCLPELESAPQAAEGATATVQASRHRVFLHDCIIHRVTGIFKRKTHTENVDPWGLPISTMTHSATD